jgi:hypothetical protein
MRQPNCERMTRSPGAVVSTTRIAASRSSAPSVSRIEPVWSTCSGQKNPRPMNEASGRAGSRDIAPAGTISDMSHRHQFTATIAPLIVIAPPAETSFVADALIAIWVPDVSAFTLALVVMFTPETSMSVSALRVIFLP